MMVLAMRPFKSVQLSEFDVQIELWLWLWGHWVVRILARAQFEHGIIDSMMVLVMRPFKSVQLSES